MFWNFVIGLLSYALQLVLTPKPQDAKPLSLEDLEAPVAEEAIEISVLFGTRDLKSPNVTWYGDLQLQAIKGKRRYGLFGPKQTIGWRYSLGMQLSFCYGPLDKITEIRVGDKEAWTGSASAGSIVIDNEDLFGGNEREGGISGTVDVEMGEPTQDANDYLESIFGVGTVPAFRGIMSLILRRVYVGTSPYIKPWAIRGQRIYLKSDGTDQWYPEKAGIPLTEVSGDVAFYIAVDTSTSVIGIRMAETKSALAGALDYLLAQTDKSYDIHIASFSSTVKDSIEFRNATPSNFDDMQDFVDNLTSSGNTNFDIGVSGASAFFAGAGLKTRVIIFISDNADQPPSDPLTGVSDAITTIAGISNVKVYCFRSWGAGVSTMTAKSLEQIDTTPEDNMPDGDVPENHGAPTALYSALNPVAGGTLYDMNPIHIIRECITEKWGMGYNDIDVDDISFQYAANLTFAESFGLSFVWATETEITEFIQTVLGHIDAVLYTSRTTGKFYIKLIRDDYVVDDLIVIDEDDVVTWDEVKRRQPAEVINSVVVDFYDHTKRDKASRMVTNIAQVAQVGQTISTPRSYLGISKESLAVRAATRDLRALGVDMVAGRIGAKRTIESLNPGDAFRLVSSRHNLDGEIMRVVDLNFGDGRSNKISLKFIQDVFGIGEDILVEASPSEWEEPVNAPEPSDPRLAIEMPYYELVNMIGQSDASSMLLSNPDAGMFEATGSSPTPDAINAILSVDAGSGYIDEGDTVDFAPSAELSEVLTSDPTDIIVAVTNVVDLSAIALGTLAAIGDEIVTVTSISLTSMTMSRGMLDTIPQEHAIGDAVIFFEGYGLSDFSQYDESDTVNIKLKTVTGSGILSLSAAPADTVDFNSRAIRPLRPANVKVEGQGYGVVDASSLSDIEVTWVERNRLTELIPFEWGDATVTPEVSQTTIIEILDPPGVSVITTHSGLTGTTFLVPLASFDGNPSGYIRVGSSRDGYREWQSYQLEVLVGSSEPLFLDLDELTLDSDTLYLGD